MNHHRIRRTLLIAGAAGLLLVPACSDDDDGNDDATGTDDTAATGDGDSPAGAPDGTSDGAGTDEEGAMVFCEGLVAVDAAITAASEGTGSPEDALAALDEIEATAPAELEDDVAVAVEFGRTSIEDPENSGPPTPEFNAAYVGMLDFAEAECGFQAMDAVAREYEYEGLPTELSAGPTVVRVTNEGEELHELLVLQVADGVTESAEELVALPEEDAQEKIAATVGGAFAPVGDTGGGVVDLAPGRYIAICFLPTGATPAAFEAMMAGGPEPDGAPHFTEGMYQEITVS